MTESPESSLHPALKFLKENAVLVGIVSVVVISLIVILLKQGSPGVRTSAPVPAITATAGAASAAPSPSATATASASPSPSATKSAAPVEAPAASPSAEAGPVYVGGTTAQSVTVQDWRPFAVKFSQAYGNTAGGKEAWLARLKPYITDNVYEGLSLTDITRVNTLTYRAIEMVQEENSYTTFIIDYVEKPDFLDALIQVQNDGTWKVDQFVRRNLK